MVGEAPVPGILLPVEEHHEVGQVALVDAVAADRAHQVHAHRVAAEREEQAVAERQDAGVAPDQVHRERDDRVAHDLAEQRHPVVGEVERAARRHQQVARPGTTTKSTSAATPIARPSAARGRQRARSAARRADADGHEARRASASCFHRPALQREQALRPLLDEDDDEHEHRDLREHRALTTPRGTC